MQVYTTADGLRSGFINYIMRDSRGFMWFCTRDGLSRFDGYRFVNYRIDDGPSSQNFEYIYEGRNGVFWIALHERGLYRYDPASVNNAPQPQADSPYNQGTTIHADLVFPEVFGAMLQDGSGNLWAAGSGLFLIEEKAGQTSVHEVDLHLPQEWKAGFVVRVMVEGRDGSLWLATSHGLLRRLPDWRVAHYSLNHTPNHQDVTALLADKNDNIWVEYPDGPHVLKPEPLSSLQGFGAFSSHQLAARFPRPGTPMPAKPGEAINLAGTDPFAGEARFVTNFCQQANEQIWMVARDRLVLFDGRQFHSFTDSRGLFSLLAEDLDGNLWITLSQGGVARFSPSGLISYGRDDGMGDQEVASIQEDRAGAVYVAGPTWWISQFGERRFKSVHPRIPDAGKLWTSTLVFLDHTGQWWFLTERGLYRFSHASNLGDLARQSPLLYTNLDSLPGQWVYCMFEDSKGDLWISVRQSLASVTGLVRWQRSGETFHKFTEKDGLPPLKSASSFAEDRAGNLWFGFYEGGLVRYAAGRFTSFAAADGLPDGFITALHIDRLGRLWLTSASGGLARVDDPTAEHPHFVRYTMREGLASDNARVLTEDLAGDIYIGTMRGLDRLTPATGKIRHYGLADGLAGDFFTTAHRDRKGALWFGTFGGLSRLDPRPDPAPVAPPIRIEGLHIAGVRQPLSEFGAPAIAGLELSSAQRNLQIDFSSLSMARASLLRYQYQLQGVDGDWSAPTGQRTIQYANLAPGKYRFLVRAVDSGGLSSVEPATVDFRIFPPFWQRWWFLTLIAIAAGSAVAWLYQYRVRHLLELERVRTHIATDLHDDIGSSLSQIAVLSEVVRRQVNGTTAVSEPLSTIASTSRELVDSMSDIVWAINPDRDNFDDLAQRMRRFASDLLATNDIEFRFHAGETARPVKLSADVRRQVFLIFKESVHNIVRHSRCANVEIDLHIENHAISLTLKDDGRGFDPEQASQGHGLMSMRQRAKALGTNLKITSQQGNGTEISLKIPLTRRHAMPS